MTLDLHDPGEALSEPERGRLDADAARVLAVVAARYRCAGEVRAKVVRDAEMAVAHEKYAGVEGTTDVLTFDMSPGSDGDDVREVDCDLFVCADVARRRAGERAHAADRELLLYILHGVLHCLGHDDHDSDAFERMHAEEDSILIEGGVGAVFTDAEGATGGAR